MSAVRVESLYCTGGCLFFLRLCSRGFQDLLRMNPPSLLMLFGCISISMASLQKPATWIVSSVIPPAQHSLIPPPLSTTCCASTRPAPGRSLYSLLALPLPCHIPSEYKYTHTYQPELFFLHLPRKMEPIEGSETSVFKPQMPGNTQKKTHYIKNMAKA